MDLEIYLIGLSVILHIIRQKISLSLDCILLISTTCLILSIYYVRSALNTALGIIPYGEDVCGKNSIICY